MGSWVHIEEVGNKSPQVGCNKLGYELLLMEILHQLRLVAYPIICYGFYVHPSPVVVWDFFHQQ